MDMNTPPESPIRESQTSDTRENELSKEERSQSLPVNQVQSVQNAVTKHKKPEGPALPRGFSHTASPGKILLRSQSILYSKDLGRVIRLLQSANGLDKCIRTIQYTTRLLSQLMLVKGLHTPSTSTATQAIRRQFGLTRKLLRAFNNIGQINAVSNLLHASPQNIRKDTLGYTLELIRGLGFTGFGLMDTLGYLPDAGILGIPYKALVDKLAFHFWLYALVAGILSGCLNIYRLRARIGEYQSIFPGPVMTPNTATTAAIEAGPKREAEKGSRELQVGQGLPPTPPESPISLNQVSVNEAALGVMKDLEMQNLNASLNVIGDSADILFPLAALKFSGFDMLGDGVLGFAGCISSAVGFRKAWKATA